LVLLRVALKIINVPRAVMAKLAMISEGSM
jgi:hypothetical protein